MADLSKIKLNGTEYHLKDTEARHFFQNGLVVQRPLWDLNTNALNLYADSQISHFSGVFIMDTYHNTPYALSGDVYITQNNVHYTITSGNRTLIDRNGTSIQDPNITFEPGHIYWFRLSPNQDAITFFESDYVTTEDISGFLQKTEIADWAKAANKPSYTASEVGAMSTSHAAAAITSTDISNWNAKSNFSGSYNDLTNKPTIPAATTVTNTLASGTLIATINGTNIYAPSYTNGDNLSYGG